MPVPAERGVVVQLGPLVRPEHPVPVVVLHDGEWWPGFVEAWCDERVSVSYTAALGQERRAWFPADRARRVQAFMQDVEE